MNRVLIGSADKTNLLLQMLEHDYARGVTIIDPTGDLARAAGNRIPACLVKHAVYFDPSNTRNVVGINALANVPNHLHQPFTELLCGLFDALFPEGSNTLARINSTHVFANCLRLLLERQDETLLGVQRLLADRDYLQDCIDDCSDPGVRTNWHNINAKAKDYAGAFAFLEAKIGMFAMSPMIRNVLTHQTLTPTDTILIANLDRAKLGDMTARLLGGLLMMRSSGPLYVHNFGFFARRSDGFTSLFPQERLTLTLNYLDELTPVMRQEVLNIEDKYVFRSNRKDAEELAFYVNVVEPKNIIDLDPGYYRTPYSDRPAVADLPPTRKRLLAVRQRTRARRSAPIEKNTTTGS